MTNTNLLTRQKCLDLLKIHGTPSHVVAHCVAVADIAKLIAIALNHKGFCFDVRLVEASGLLHDMARTDEKHWEVAADFLTEKGYHKEADIIRVHMHHHFPENARLSTETDLVCLGDRLVMENKYVGLSRRIDYIIKKAGDNPEVVQRIENNKALIGKYISDLEAILGTTIESLVREQENNERQ